MAAAMFWEVTGRLSAEQIKVFPFPLDGLNHAWVDSIDTDAIMPIICGQSAR